MTPDSLNVIALISGGKDSLFSLLHVLANGHKIIALANLYPASKPFTYSGAGNDEDDINSYMYQTVGHTVIPLYADALGIRLYREQIRGSAIDAKKEYHCQTPHGGTTVGNDETESLIPLLRRVMREHPSANAVSTGAILSDYQRTRIESVAIRLGLVPLSYLWQYPYLWGEDAAETKLLNDMRAVGQVARIIKVASGGLDSQFLWADVGNVRTGSRLVRATGRFGTSGSGAVLGEGGEYETLAVDGPRVLWEKRIEIDEEERAIVEGGGGSAFLRFKGAKVVEKEDMSARPGATEGSPIVPGLARPRLLDSLSEKLLKSLHIASASTTPSLNSLTTPAASQTFKLWSTYHTPHTLYVSNMLSLPPNPSSPADALTSILTNLLSLLAQYNTTASSIAHTTILLRSFTDFTPINKTYSAFFPRPLPPARATFACGDLLPEGVDVMLSVVVDLGPCSARRGLHVQSRSYWAPANIGPYSQAIASPLSQSVDGEDPNTPDSLVHVAGQIPLEPSTMETPRPPAECDDGEEELFKFQAILSLQHLWRIGRAMDVKWWVGGVAFLSRSESAQQRASIASAVWRERNLASLGGIKNGDDEETLDGEGDGAEGPDIWDRTFGGAKGDLGDGGASREKLLPDFSLIFSPTSHLSVSRPPLFTVEVHSLPRGSLIEWSSLGVSGPNQVHITSETFYCASSRVLFRKCQLSGCGEETRITYATVLKSNENTDLAVVLKELMLVEELQKSAAPKPRRIGHVAFYSTQEVNWDRVWDEEALRRVGRKPSVMVVPCWSVWGEEGDVRAGLVIRSERLVDS